MFQKHRSTLPQLRPRLATHSRAPALEGGILEDGTVDMTASSEVGDRHAIAQIHNRQVGAHLTGLVTHFFKVAISKLTPVIRTPALYRAVGQHLPQAM